jgi:hypothetical protein
MNICRCGCAKHAHALLDAGQPCTGCRCPEFRLLTTVEGLMPKGIEE